MSSNKDRITYKIDDVHKRMVSRNKCIPRLGNDKVFSICIRQASENKSRNHDDVTTWNTVPVTSPLRGESTGHKRFLTRNRWWSVDSSPKRPLVGALLISLFSARTTYWTNNHIASHLRCHDTNECNLPFFCGVPAHRELTPCSSKVMVYGIRHNIPLLD